MAKDNVEKIEQKPETAENWIGYFINRDNNTPIEVPQGELLQWENWWELAKMGNMTMPPHTTMVAITEKHAEPIEPIVIPSGTTIPMEFTKKSRKKFVMPPEMGEKKVKEPSASGLLW